MPDSISSISLSEFDGGELQRLFDKALQATIKALSDEDVDCKVKQKITITFTFEGSSTRDGATVTAEVKGSVCNGFIPCGIDLSYLVANGAILDLAAHLKPVQTTLGV